MTKVHLHKAYDNSHYFTIIDGTWYAVVRLKADRWALFMYDNSNDYNNRTNGLIVEYFKRLKGARQELQAQLENRLEAKRIYEERKAARDAHEASEREPLVFPETEEQPETAAPIDTVEKLQKLYDLLAECSDKFAEERDTLEVSGGWWSLLDELDAHGKHSVHEVVAYLCPYPRYYEN